MLRATTPLAARLALRVGPALLALVGCASPPAAAREPARATGPLADLAWLAGDWGSAESDERVEEHWMTPAGDVMLGMGRTVRAEKAVEWEHMRLEVRPEGTFFVALPSGQAKAEFRLVTRGPGTATFENPEHDYPQRIVYQRSGATLTGRIETMSGERAVRWTYSPMSP
jgi:hypothetical protein